MNYIEHIKRIIEAEDPPIRNERDTLFIRLPHSDKMDLMDEAASMGISLNCYCVLLLMERKALLK